MVKKHKYYTSVLLSASLIFVLLFPVVITSFQLITEDTKTQINLAEDNSTLRVEEISDASVNSVSTLIEEEEEEEEEVSHFFVFFVYLGKPPLLSSLHERSTFCFLQIFCPPPNLA